MEISGADCRGGNAGVENAGVDCRGIATDELSRMIINAIALITSKTKAALE